MDPPDKAKARAQCVPHSMCVGLVKRSDREGGCSLQQREEQRTFQHFETSVVDVVTHQ